MTLLALGLALFLGIHLVRALAPGWRDAQRARLGERRWKGLYSLAAGVGLVLILWGFSRARLEPIVLWPHLPFTVNRIAGLLMAPAAVLMVAAYVPRNHIKAKLRHPMTLSVKLWAFAHLIANNTLADLMLFGSFLVWSVLVFRAARRRPQPPVAPGTPAGTMATVVLGLALWAVFAFWAHEAWLGIAPLGH